MPAERSITQGSVTPVSHADFCEWEMPSTGIGGKIRERKRAVGDLQESAISCMANQEAIGSAERPLGRNQNGRQLSRWQA